MIDKLIRLLGAGSSYTRRHPQLLSTMLLIVVIPVAFLVSGQQFLNAARGNQERLEKDRIGLMHDTFAAFLEAAAYDPVVIQPQIERLVALNPDITDFRVSREEGTDLRVIASLDPSHVEAFDEKLDVYHYAHVNPDQSYIQPTAKEGVRYWQAARLALGASGINYIIFTEHSLESIDTLFAKHIMTAYYWLVGLILIVLFLIMRHVRLIDYAYLYNETKKANEMKDLFTNMIAHELRAPLTAMRGYASMIRENNTVDSQVRSQATRIEDAAERLVLIVNDLLDVARIQSGKLRVTKENVKISELIVSVIESLQVSAQERQITISHEGVHADVLIIGDEKRLYQALTNLVSNAIKYTKQGSITVSLEERKDRVEIRVKDTGMGISAENQKNLFAPFFRVENAEVNSITGTGLGMWITKQLIELMGGSIGVESIKGVGTHVVVTLPKQG